MLSFWLSTLTNPADRDFVSQMYVNYERIMYATARRYTRDTALQQDVVHDSVEKLIKKISEIRDLKCCVLEVYIVSTIRNTMFNELKRNQRRYRFREPMPEEELPDLSLEEMHQTVFREECLKRIWEKLEPSKVILLEGKYILGYEDRELAKILHYKTNSIRMELTRARRHALKLILELEDERNDKT